MKDRHRDVLVRMVSLNIVWETPCQAIVRVVLKYSVVDKISPKCKRWRR